MPVEPFLSTFPALVAVYSRKTDTTAITRDKQHSFVRNWKIVKLKYWTGVSLITTYTTLSKRHWLNLNLQEKDFGIIIKENDFFMGMLFTKW